MGNKYATPVFTWEKGIQGMWKKSRLRVSGRNLQKRATVRGILQGRYGIAAGCSL